MPQPVVLRRPNRNTISSPLPSAPPQETSSENTGSLPVPGQGLDQHLRVPLWQVIPILWSNLSVNGCWFFNASVTSRQPHTLVKYRQKEGINYPNQSFIKERLTGVKNNLHQSNLLTESNNLRSPCSRTRPRRPLPAGAGRRDGSDILCGEKRTRHCLELGGKGSRRPRPVVKQISSGSYCFTRRSSVCPADGCGAASSKLLT